jgi:hypothetical protein
MSSARARPAGAVMPGGNVLVAGGDPSNLEVYNPGGNAWGVAGGGQTDSRPAGPTATAFSGGVMIVGGVDSSQPGTVAGDVDIYDPITGTARVARFHPQNGGRDRATATLLSDGTVLVAGGEQSTNPAGALSSTDIWDPSIETGSQCSQSLSCSSWISGPALNVGHCNHSATLLANGLVLIAGGGCGTGDPISVCELYDPKARTWTAGGNLQDPRKLFPAVLLPNGQVLAAGGIFPGGTVSNDAELYTAAG